MELTLPNIGTRRPLPSGSSCKWLVIASKTTQLNISLHDMAFQFCERNGRDYIELIENYRTRDIKRIDICKMPRRSVLIDGDVAIRYIEKSSKATISDDTKIIITATKSLTNFLID